MKIDRKAPKHMARIEIVTTDHQLPDKLVKSYGVEPEKVAETSYFTIFALTIPRSTSEKDFGILDPFLENQDIVAYE